MQVEHKEEYEIITEVPERFEGKRKLALQWALKHADTVEILQRRRGRSMYRFYFDDGVYKGGARFEVHHQALSPLRLYILAEQTGWPGLKLDWLESIATEEMQRELEL